MSGFYNNWFKVQNPNSENNIPPMLSNGKQPPFYFGGSSVPTMLEYHNTNTNIKGSGLNNYSKINFKPAIRSIQTPSTNYHIQSNIQIPKSLGSLNKQF